MRPELRDRIVLPILLPLGILVLIAGALFGFSRILLNVTHTAATGIALVVAAAVVGVSAIAASRAHIRTSTIAAMVGAITGTAMLSGGIALAVLSGGHGEEGEEPGGPGAIVALTAQDIAFQPADLTVPAGAPFTIAFDNRDAGVQHNVDIFAETDFSGTALFEGELVTGAVKVDYEVSPLDAGSYAFRCVVHPQMTGTIEAAEGGAGETPGGVTVSAQSLAFDTSEIALPPDAPSTITFDNDEAGVQHNISIYSDENLGELLFQGEIVTGPASVDYEVPPQPAGEYYFHCDVHPTMNGIVVVGGPGGGSGEPGAGATGPPTGPTASTGASGPPTGSGGEGEADPATVVAQGLAFDTDMISLPTGAETSLTFENRDPTGVPHNISIYQGEAAVFTGDIVPGSDTVEYAIPPLDAGEYRFQCDVHPAMSGTVTVG